MEIIGNGNSNNKHKGKEEQSPQGVGESMEENDILRQNVRSSTHSARRVVSDTRRTRRDSTDSRWTRRATCKSRRAISMLPVFKKKKKKGKKKREKKALLPGMIEALSEHLLKYWVRRNSLFSRFDDGVKCDEQGLFSVTPEVIAKHQALLCGSGGIVVDAFTGVGGNAIQFASRQNQVIAIDINPRRIKCARHNAKVYGVAHHIDFIVGDFFGLAPYLKADIVFLSPPWGGPDYRKAATYDIETMLQPKDGFSLFSVALSVAPSVVLFLPRTVDMEQLEQLAWLTNPPLAYKVEKNHVNGYLKAVTVYYGDVAAQESHPDQF